MKKLSTITILVLTSLLFTTGAMAQKPKTAALDFFPLRVGDFWQYRNTEGTSEYTLKVLSAEKQADGKMRYLVEKLSGVKINLWYSKPNEWVLLHHEAYPEHEGLEVKYEPARQYLKNPLVAGAKWDWSGKSVTQVDMSESHEVIGLETVKVPAGTFRAMKIVSKVSEGVGIKTVTSWYADGVGLVKYETVAGTIKYGFELVDYNFKKGNPQK